MAEITRRVFLAGLAALAVPLARRARKRGLGITPFGVGPFGR
jgi:hypothetical protein